MHKGLFAIASLMLSSLPLDLGASQENAQVEMRVKQVTVDPYSKSPVVILEGPQNKDLIPIWIGVSEARSIAMELEHVATPRPLTHDLIRNILQGVGATLYRVTITDLRNNTYFATLTVKLKGQDFQIDSRPSDAIAVALKMKAPIYASGQVLAKAKQLPSPEMPRDDIKKILGIHLQNLTAELAGVFELQTKRGVLVADVELGSPASQAGIQRGDIILRANDRPIHKVGDLDTVIQAAKKPSQLKVQVWRKGRTFTVALDLPAES